ncbi:MAG: N-6 DNA methylase [Deltaproteobacteria bacterium]|nr:N-6 DNA methylase [Deltaproteobacteria bacterium]
MLGVVRCFAAARGLRGCFEHERDEIADEVERSLVGTIDFAALGTEYIGIFYQGLLDYELDRQRELVRRAGARKGSGTFYTPLVLARPTARRTLAPLLYENGVVNEPERILQTRVCDPAMGTGSFLVAAVEVLTDALAESLARAGRLEAREQAKVRVIERCVYGVDVDPLAVELARRSLWLEAGDPRLSLDFLDHRLRCGDSLIGCWRDRVEHYPLAAWEREGGDRQHASFVHHYREVGTGERRGDVWTQAIKERKPAIEQELAAYAQPTRSEPQRAASMLGARCGFGPATRSSSRRRQGAFVRPRRRPAR